MPRKRLKNAKAKGSRNERRVRKTLEARGYRVVKSAGSLGPADLVALKGNRQLLIQVKSNRIPAPAERKALTDLQLELPLWVVQIWVVCDGSREALVFGPDPMKPYKTTEELEE